MSRSATRESQGRQKLIQRAEEVDSMSMKGELAEWKIEKDEEMKSDCGHKLGFMSRFSE